MLIDLPTSVRVTKNENYFVIQCFLYIWKGKLFHYILDQNTTDNHAVPHFGQVLEHSSTTTQITSPVWRVGCGAFVLILIYLLTATGSTPGGSSTVHIDTQTIHKTTQLTTLVGRLSGIRTQSGQTKINDELTA